MDAKKKNALDTTLQQFQAAALDLSKLIQNETAVLKAGKYELPELYRMAEAHSRTLLRMVELAPFLDFRSQIEGIEGFREWLLTSQEYIGETRQSILEALNTYQQSIIDTENIDVQYTLL